MQISNIKHFQDPTYFLKIRIDLLYNTLHFSHVNKYHKICQTFYSLTIVDHVFSFTVICTYKSNKQKETTSVPIYTA